MGQVKLRIQDLTDAKGWALQELAQRSGVHYGTLQTYASGTALNAVDLSIVYKIARALEATLEDLVVVIEE
ncbi:MAG: helix-turn-helix transcriptional regulator [Oculatellaceae cyanobacterium Prado106]|jgi:transcriptional regulator with XRE-family HTH domain|nr:helix-turn-helix transcriptional regulator [Oculatellaceae cyanobacterium Prado106]